MTKYFIVLSMLLCSCDNFSFGEGIILNGLVTEQINGHTYIIYRHAKGVSMLHDVECERCRYLCEDNYD